MTYVVIGILILILLAVNTASRQLGKLLKSANSIDEKIINLNNDTKQINEILVKHEDEKENSNKKHVKKLEINFASRDYMTKMYGFIEQTKMFFPQQISRGIETLPLDNINDYIKRSYLWMFERIMIDNDLKFNDFKVVHTYDDWGKDLFFIKFELKDTKYIGFDEWVSKATLVVEMKNSDIKEFEVESYANNLEEYIETEYEYDKVHFFDALPKAYRSFRYDNKNYSSFGDQYVIVLNDLIEQYNKVGEQWNVVFATPLDEHFGNYWSGESDDKYVRTYVINEAWSIEAYQDVQILKPKVVHEKYDELFNSLLDSEDDDDKFKLATMYYYMQFNWDYHKKEGYYQEKATKIWKKLAEKGHAYSQLIMGILYFDGLFLLKNYAKSKHYVELAFENGFEVPAKKVWEDLKLYDH